MSSALASIVLPDHLTTALENRAFREGILSIEDFSLAEIQRPHAGPPSADEDVVMDTLCLYDSVMTEEKRFNLSPINSLADEPVVEGKPHLARRVRLDLKEIERRVKGGAGKIDVEPEVLAILRRLGGIKRGRIDLDVAEAHWLHLRNEASHEAQFFLRRDLRYFLADAKHLYEGEERGLELDLFGQIDATHSAVADFLRRNLFWLVEHLDHWHGDGDHNHHLDTSELWDVPKDVKRQLVFLSRTSRLESYFRFLQDAYASLFESAFVSRLLGIETAYERAPALPLSADQPLRTAAAAQIIRVNLADIAEYFPLPRCLEEAVETRSHPRVVAFRRALDRWLSAAATGDRLEARLRGEVERANREIRALKRWKTVKENPIYFGLKTAGSFLPPVGMVIAAVDTIDYFVERNSRSRTAWLVAPRSRLD